MQSSKEMRRTGTFFLALVLLVNPGSAWAYVGPGAGIGAIAAFVGVLLFLIIALFGFLWYPIKRMRQKRSGKNSKSQAD